MKEKVEKLRQELVKLQMKCDKEKHKMKMKELQYIRENENIHHENELSRGRIKSAEIRKSQERKAHLQDYGRRN